MHCRRRLPCSLCEVAQFAGVLKRCSLYPASKAADIAQEPKRMLDLAKKNLGRYDHILIYEDLHNVKPYLQRVFANWNVDVPSKLRHHGKRSVVANSAEREAVGQFNAVDIEFYRYAVEKYHAQLKSVGLE